MSVTPKVLDLFCGIGGLSLGLKRAGFHSIGGIDNWKEAAKTYEHNHAPERCLIADISKLQVSDISAFFGASVSDIDVMVGGPPCQGFSTVGKRDAKDPRNSLWEHYLDLVNQIRPAYVVIENVEGLVVMDRGGVCERIVESFQSMGYNAEWKLLRSADYGVPQLRKRVIFMASLDGLVTPDYPQPTTLRHVSVADAISDLPELESGESATEFRVSPCSDYQRNRRKEMRMIHNHEAAKHPPHLIELLSFIPDGGNRKSIPDHLQPKSGFHNSYARLASNKPAIAVTSNMRKPSSARTTHPSQNRGLTVREGLRLQTFDDDFVVLGSRSSQYLQVGNAVPPLLAQAVGIELMKAFKGNAPGKIAAIRADAKKRPPVKSELQFALELGA